MSQLAKKYGMRYVHLPHGYDGIPEERIAELAKAVRDLPQPGLYPLSSRQAPQSRRGHRRMHFRRAAATSRRPGDSENRRNERKLSRPLPSRYRCKWRMDDGVPLGIN